jgi:hypothetical protein
MQVLLDTSMTFSKFIGLVNSNMYVLGDSIHDSQSGALNALIHGGTSLSTNGFARTQQA